MLRLIIIFFRDKVAKKEIQIRFIFSQDQLADVFTKPLPTASFTAFRFNLRVDPPPSHIYGKGWLTNRGVQKNR
jgi:hypothetical protein